jgi:Penicillinase repressor.
LEKILNKSEEKIMDLLWDVGEPMTISEIEEQLQGDNISKATLFKAIQSLSVEKIHMR